MTRPVSLDPDPQVVFERSLYSTFLLASLCIGLLEEKVIERNRRRAHYLRSLLNKCYRTLLSPAEQVTAEKEAKQFLQLMVPSTDEQPTLLVMMNLCALAALDDPRRQDLGCTMKVVQLVADQRYGPLIAPRAMTPLDPLTGQEFMLLDFMSFITEVDAAVLGSQERAAQAELGLTKAYRRLLAYYEMAAGMKERSTYAEQLAKLFPEVHKHCLEGPRACWVGATALCLPSTVLIEPEDRNLASLIYVLLQQYPVEKDVDKSATGATKRS